MKFGFIGPTYENRSLSVDAQRTLNLYPETIESGAGKNVVAFHGTPGTSLFATLTSGPVRGLFASDESGGRLLAAGNDALYDVTSGGDISSLGAIASTTSDPVSISFNGAEYLVIADNTGYILSGTTLTAITDADFTALTPNHGIFLDSYFITFDTNTQIIYISGAYDGTAWDPLEFTSAESSPDDLVTIAENAEVLWLFGAEKTEIFTNTGNVDFPFERVQGAVSEEGCAAARTVAKLGGGLAWLAGNFRGTGRVVLAQGVQPQRISTHAVEKAINGYATISDAIAYSYIEEGHEFYVLNFPTDQTTWVFDLTSKMWHERSYWDAANGKHRDILGQSHAFVYGKHLVGDRRNGKIYTQSLDTYDDNSEAIRRVRRAPYVSEENKVILHRHLELDMETGVGLVTGQGSDPQVMMRYSDDKAHTWSTELQGSIGKIGEYADRVKWNRLGTSRHRIYEIAITDPVKVAFTDAYLKVEMGGNG